MTAAIDPAFWLTRWDLVPDGESRLTRSSLLLPVRRHGQAAMLKIACEEEERRGGRLMAWWDGEGVARVLAHDDRAILLERAQGTRSLAAMAAAGRDDEATLVLCAVAGRLHAPRPRPPPDLVPLACWFAALSPVARTAGGRLVKADAMAQSLLAAPREPVVLHGDLHHGNVLDGGDGGWLAIDPKGLSGERSFDFVNILRNPEPATALAPQRFARQVERLAELACIERQRLLQWTLAFAGLSAAWHLGDGESPDADLALAGLADAALAS